MNKIDQAWEEERYDEVLLLLQQDSFYPDNFNYEDLDDCDAGKPLKDFVDEIHELHENVRNDDLVKVKEITSRYKSEFYFNSENQSAALTALENKKFRIYAYLKWIGVVSGDDEEKLIDKDLGTTEKETLQEALRSYFREDDASSILHLSLNSKSVNASKNFRDKMTEYYIKLNTKIPDILNVFRYENNLEITFYCKGENAVGEAGDDCYGVTAWSDFDYLSEISIHWDPMGEDETLGNLAYKLTLFAMKMVFKNECKPYQVMDSTGKTEFEEITEHIKANLTNLSGAEEDNLAKAFKSNSAHHHSELIARVTQTLAEFQNGEEWLQNNTPDLLAFYREKVIPKCQEFVNRNFLIKPRNVIKSLNEKFGEITSLVKINLFFVNLGFLTEFLNSQKISVIVTKNSRLGLIRVLQALQRKMYVDYYDNFVVFKTENCLTFLPDIKIAFGSEEIEFLLLDCASVSNSSLKDGIAEITSRLGHDKKIIFVAEENQMEVFEEYSKSNPSWGLMRDENFCLDDLDLESEEKILQKEILLQGRKTNLDEWFGHDTEFRKLITSDIIWQLVCEGPHKIGNEIFGTSNLEGSYAQILQKINIESLMRKIEKSDAVFIFMGDKDKFTKLNLKGEIAPLDLKNLEAINKKLLWADENFEDRFKEFCQNNPIKKVYLINISADGTLVLQQIYSPDFHMKRKIRKIVVDVGMLEDRIEYHEEETFIFTGGGSIIENWKKKYSNVKLSDELEGWLDSEGIIHWFQVENGVLIWKNSRGSIENVAEAISEELSFQHLMEENELVKDALERKVVIISDVPGMGKSTTITKLYESPDIIKSHWIIRINLKDCGKEIKNLPATDFTITNVISFLQGAEKNLNNTLTTHFLDLVLDPQKRISKDLLLVFDGFDELSDEEDENKTINLLKFLNNETKSKVWIECRLDYKNLFQDKLNSFALQFSPIDNEMKKKVIKKYYGDRLNLVLSEEQLYDAFNGDKAEIYFENFISKMESVFQGSLSTILGAPLQLNLLLDNSTQYFLRIQKFAL